MEGKETQKMNWYVSPPGFIRGLFKETVWESKSNKILLTFDDSPTEGVTERILEKLSQTNLKVVFFCSGEKSEREPDLVNQIIKAGHTIGNHGYNHKSLLFSGKPELTEEIKKVNKIFKNSHDIDIRYFRPPYGRFTFSLETVLKNENMINILWSLLTLDYKNNLNLVKFTVGKYLNSNSIVVLHDNIKTNKIINQVIDMILAEAEKRGFEIGEPKECLS